jgi:hypothetical protein
MLTGGDSQVCQTDDAKRFLDCCGRNGGHCVDA